MPPLESGDSANSQEIAQLRAEIAALKARLAESADRLEVAEATVQAIRLPVLDFPAGACSLPPSAAAGTAARSVTKRTAVNLARVDMFVIPFNA